ncbi:hypothetical protein ACFLRY_03885 [Bacteroidota bacterium]
MSSKNKHCKFCQTPLPENDKGILSFFFGKEFCTIQCKHMYRMNGEKSLNELKNVELSD